MFLLPNTLVQKKLSLDLYPLTSSVSVWCCSTSSHQHSFSAPCHNSMWNFWCFDDLTNLSKISHGCSFWFTGDWQTTLKTLSIVNIAGYVMKYLNIYGDIHGSQMMTLDGPPWNLISSITTIAVVLLWWPSDFSPSPTIWSKLLFVQT